MAKKEKKDERLEAQKTDEAKQVYLSNFQQGMYSSLYIDEVLQYITELKDEDAKIEALRKNATDSLMTFLFYVYDTEQINFTVSFEDVENLQYKETVYAEHSMYPMSLKRDYKLLKTFTNETVKKEKMLTIVIRWLESLHPNEAKLFKKMFKRDISEFVTDELVRKAYPSLLTPKK